MEVCGGLYGVVGGKLRLDPVDISQLKVDGLGD